MTKKILFSLLLAFILTSIAFKTTQVAKALDKTQEVQQFDPGSVGIEAKKLDKKAEILAAFLAKHNSPLQYHAQDFIDAAKQYNLDWKLVPAIAGVESTFGKFIPGGYNGWGWGVYGTQAIYFDSWTDAIFTISKGLRENYLDKGLTDPYSINKVYAASPSWGSKVSYFMEDLEKFASQFEIDNKDLLITSVNPQIAAVSGQPVLR